MTYDFDYYPPRKIEIYGPPTPAELLPPLQPICEGVWLASEDVESWLATGNYVNIEDFWLAANPPKRHQIMELRGDTIVTSKTYLSNATYAFHQMCYELARDTSNESWEFLFYEAFNIYDREIARDQILLETQKAKDFLDVLKQGQRQYIALKSKSLRLIERVLYEDDQVDESQRPAWTTEDTGTVHDSGIITNKALTKFIADRYQAGPTIAPSLASKILNAVVDPSGELRREHMTRWRNREEQDTFRIEEVSAEQVYDYVDNVNAERMKDPNYCIPGMGLAPFAKLHNFAEELRRTKQDS